MQMQLAGPLGAREEKKNANEMKMTFKGPLRILVTIAASLLLAADAKSRVTAAG